jgi:nucleotide-binding universal stress UspA family protein
VTEQPAQPAADIRTTARLIVAWVSEDDELDHVLRAATDLAAANGAKVILYNRDTASPFSDPLPNAWASQGEERQFGDPLTDAELIKLGQEPFARKVVAAREAGADAWGWLASDHGTDEFVEYARGHGADLVVLPEELEDPGMGAKLKGETAGKAVEEAEEASDGLAVLLVDTSGTATVATGRL